MALFKFGNGNRRWYIIGLGMAAFLVYMFVAPKLTGNKGRATPTPFSDYIPDQLPFGGGGEVAPAPIPAEMEGGPASGMRLAGAGYAPPMVNPMPFRNRIIVT